MKFLINQTYRERSYKSFFKLVFLKFNSKAHDTTNKRTDKIRFTSGREVVLYTRILLDTRIRRIAVPKNHQAECCRGWKIAGRTKPSSHGGGNRDFCARQNVEILERIKSWKFDDEQ